MSGDLERLVEHVFQVMHDEPIAPHGPMSSYDRDFYRTAIRAVLQELKEPLGKIGALDGGGGEWDSATECCREEAIALIDHILSEPTP